MFILLKSETIKGNCQIPGHEKAIVIEDVNFNVSRSVSQGSGYNTDRVSGLAHGSPIQITKAAGMCDLELLKQTFNGKGQDVEILFLKQNGRELQELFTIKVIDALFSNFSFAGSGQMSTPIIQVAVNYDKLEFAQHVYNEKDSSSDVFRSLLNFATGEGS